MKNNLHNETSFNDCLHLITKFLVSSSKSIPKIEKKKKKKKKPARKIMISFWKTIIIKI